MAKFFLLTFIMISIVKAQHYFKYAAKIVSQREVGTLIISEREMFGDFIFNTTKFSTSFIVKPNNKNLISANSLVYLFSLIDSKITKSLFFPLSYSTFSVEYEYFRTGEFHSRVQVGLETNYYLFYKETTMTSASNIELLFFYDRSVISIGIEKPWLNAHYVNLKPNINIGYSIRFD